VLTDTYIRQPTEPRDEPAVNLQISLRTEPPTALLAEGADARAVGGSGKAWQAAIVTRALYHAPSCLFDATWLDAAVLKDGRDIGLPGLAAGDRAEDHEPRDHESCASNE
jgi:hypothetical protein